MSISVLHTPRLVLRPPVVQDAEFFVKAMKDRRIWEWLSVIPQPYTRADALSFINDIAPQDRSRVIVDQHGPVGVIGCSDELGYWLIPEAWGQGYITEAGDAVVDWFFEETDCKELKSGHFCENTRSKSALLKLGFVDAGPTTLGCVSDGRTDIPSRAMIQTRARWQDRRQLRLSTDRLTLRELHPSDAPALAAALGHAEVAQNLISITVPWAEPDVQRFIARCRYRGRPGFRLGVFQDGDLVGTVGLGRGEGGVPVAMYAFAPSTWGQGIATESMTAFMAEVDRRFDPPLVKADHFSDNMASGAVLRKLGFVETGTDMGTSPLRDGAHPLTLYERTRG